MNKIAVCTANTGGHDHTHKSVFHPNVDYLYFTDGIVSAPEGWQQILLPKSRLDSRTLSKFPKIIPHQILELQDYRYLVWIDADMSIRRPDFPLEVIAHLKNGLVLSPHFDGRNDAYGEVQASSGHPKYANQPFAEQVAYYRKVGYPGHTGLFEAGVIARDMQAPGVREVGEAWWFEICSWSYQDQISLPFALWKTRFTPDVLPKSFRYYDWVDISIHVNEEI